VGLFSSALTTLAPNTKSKASGKQNQNKTKNNQKSKKTNNPSQINITVKTAPVSAQPRMSVKGVSKTKSNPSGTTSFTSQTCIPINATANTASTTYSALVAVGNGTLFPQAATLSQVHDKVKFHKLRAQWVPSLPTTCGGSVVMYFDTDKSDIGPTSMTEAMQNRGANSGPLWSRQTYNCSRQMLRTGEMFSTLTGSVATAPENTFSSPGRFHLFATPQPGVTYTTSTTIGFLVIEYELEFMFPSAKVDTTIPTRRLKEQSRDTSFVVYNPEIVDTYQNFRAGCVIEPDFYTFLSLFDGDGNLDRVKAQAFQPDSTSLLLYPVTSKVVPTELFHIRRPNVGDLNSGSVSGSSWSLLQDIGDNLENPHIYD
jgi:hypothetical protein